MVATRACGCARSPPPSCGAPPGLASACVVAGVSQVTWVAPHLSTGLMTFTKKHKSIFTKGPTGRQAWRPPVQGQAGPRKAFFTLTVYCAIYILRLTTVSSSRRRGGRGRRARCPPSRHRRRAGGRGRRRRGAARLPHELERRCLVIPPGAGPRRWRVGGSGAVCSSRLTAARLQP